MQRVAIASVLAMQPKVLVLDEPDFQLDPVGSREVFSAIRTLSDEGETTVIMIEHSWNGWLCSPTGWSPCQKDRSGMDYRAEC
jgi:energy-coupling factor transporter ATP-binding protein EcfA2